MDNWNLDENEPLGAKGLPLVGEKLARKLARKKCGLDVCVLDMKRVQK